MVPKHDIVGVLSLYSRWPICSLPSILVSRFICKHTMAVLLFNGVAIKSDEAKTRGKGTPLLSLRGTSKASDVAIHAIRFKRKNLDCYGPSALVMTKVAINCRKT